MILYDCICLGRTVPEESKKYGKKVCSIFYSPELRQLIRVYPLMIDNPCKVRTVADLDLIPNPHDSREESFKLKHPEDGIISVHATKEQSDIRKILESKLIDSIKTLNSRRKSIGVIKSNAAGIIKTISNQPDIDQDQKLLFDDIYESMSFKTKIVPYICFSDATGNHTLQIREWGTWEYIRKNDESPKEVFGGLGLSDSEQYLIVGNMNNYRTNWLVVKTYRAVNESIPLFDS